MKFYSVKMRIPSHWISAIVNGDESSFDYYDDNEDFEAYKQFCHKEISGAIVEPLDGESFFDKYHHARDYGVLACDVTECFVHFTLKDQKMETYV